MEIRRNRQRQFEDVEMEGCRGVTISRLFVHEGGRDWPCLRQFNLDPGDHTANHQHPWFHQIIVGRGILRLNRGDNVTDLNEGDAVLIEAGERHQFHNPNHYPVDFFCMIPGDADTGS